MSAVLSVRHVEKCFGAVRAVDDVSFDVPAGTITGLLGRNGAGKTTILRMVNGIFLPDRGSIEIFGGALDGRTRDRIAYLPEERGLYRQMRVMEMLLFLAEIKGRRAASVRSAAESWLSRLSLWEKKDARVEELSKGNQQKVQIIGALLHEPDLVILDEPLSGLDPVNVVLVRGILRELKAQGRTILLSTHMMPEAEKTVDRIVLVHEGRLVLAGELDEVKRSYGRNTVHIDFEGDGAFLGALPGVAQATVQPNAAELRLDDGADGQALLAHAAARLVIRRFELAAPSLEEIFIERVGRDAAEAGAPATAAAGEVRA